MAVLTLSLSPYGGEGWGLLGMSMERHWLARSTTAHTWIWTTSGKLVVSSADRHTNL